MKIYKKPKVTKEAEIVLDDIDFLTFYNVLKPSNLDLTLFKKNITQVKVIENNNVSFHASMYNPLLNELVISRNHYQETIMHELFHVSSSYINYNNNICYTGFTQKNIKTYQEIGRGLTEGYTALLDERYFKDYTDNKESLLKETYKLTKTVVLELEMIVGREAMEYYYSTCDIYSLIKCLASLTNLKETLSFIRNIDNMFKWGDNMRYSNPLFAIHYYEKCRLYLIKLCLSLFTKNYQEGYISTSDYLEGIRLTKEELTKDIKTNSFLVIKSHKYTSKMFDRTLEDVKKIYKIK